MEFYEITINDKALFDRYLLRYNPQSSELTFTNLFMWKSFYRFRYAEIDGLLCVVAAPEKEEPFALMPVGEINSDNFTGAVTGLAEYFSARGWKLQFKKVAWNELVHFKNLPDRKMDIVYDRDNSDYVYLTEDLIDLKGKKFHDKKNHINKFLKTYKYEYVKLDKDLIGECARIMEEWCQTRNCECARGEYCEKYANEEVLENYEALGCKGALIKVDGRFEAFTVGEMLNSDTAVIHIEKAKFSIPGLYAFINWQFCKNEWSGVTYINREQDLGQEGLRKAKLSYNPVKMVDKYTVVFL